MIDVWRLFNVFPALIFVFDCGKIDALNEGADDVMRGDVLRSHGQ